MEKVKVKSRAKKGQAVLELAVFGSIILFALGVLLSFFQQLNDQQYTRMEAFRRALYHACTNHAGGSGAGSSVQYLLFQNRKYADLSSNFRKGSPSIASASASVSWAVPEISNEAEAARHTVVNINGVEQVAQYRSYVSRDEERFDREGNEKPSYSVFQVGAVNFTSQSNFAEESRKQEDTRGITNIRSSTSTDTDVIDVKYEKVHKHTGSNSEVLIGSGSLFNATNVVTEGHTSTWRTDF